VTIASTAVAALRAGGKSLSSVLDTSAARDRMKALGLAPSPAAKADSAAGGMSLLELLVKKSATDTD